MGHGIVQIISQWDLKVKQIVLREDRARYTSRTDAEIDVKVIIFAHRIRANQTFAAFQFPGKECTKYVRAY